MATTTTTTRQQRQILQRNNLKKKWKDFWLQQVACGNKVFFFDLFIWVRTKKERERMKYCHFFFVQWFCMMMMMIIVNVMAMCVCVWFVHHAFIFFCLNNNQYHLVAAKKKQPQQLCNQTTKWKEKFFQCHFFIIIINSQWSHIDSFTFDDNMTENKTKKFFFDILDIDISCEIFKK